MSYTPLPIGIDDFKKLISNGYYYVDKTWLIKELLDKKGEVNLFTRPRRFGKTLNLSMLRYYFELSGEGKGCQSLFDGLKIMKAGEKYTGEQGQYPVITLTLKSAKQKNYENAYVCMKEEIASEFQRHRIVMNELSVKSNRSKFYDIMSRTAEEGDYLTSLKFLSECLYEVYQKKAIILIDEYDVPLENAFYSGFYEEMITFIRSLFESALKSNPFLEFSVITGCLRISKESIFTGLNNLKINSILSGDYGEHFGFVEEEVRQMLSFFKRESKMHVMKEWYDGYQFGQTEVYNPWSVINYTESLYGDQEVFPTAAWSNTSSNSIVKDLIYHAGESVKEEIETLIAGGTIEKQIHEDITYEDVYESEDNLWNFLFFTGYLKQVSKKMREDDIYVTFAIPNREVCSIYRDKVIRWFRNEIKVQDLSSMYEAMLTGNVEVFQQELTKQLQKSISYMDGKEAFYHGFLLGVLANLGGYIVKSNREAGDGRYDILIRHVDETISPVILELKVSDTFRGLDAACERALAQIGEKQYDAWLVEDGYTKVIRYGISFYKKKCRMKMVQKELE